MLIYLIGSPSQLAVGVSYADVPWPAHMGPLVSYDGERWCEKIMTKQQAIEDIIETWNKYKEIDHPEYTSDDQRIADNLLNDISNLLN